MIGGKKQEQTSGDNSNNFQAETMTIVQPDEGTIRAIVDKQLEVRLELLTGEAFGKYKERCQDFSDGLVMAFKSTYTAHVERLREPSVQFSINSAQRAYGESGDLGMKDTLISIVGKMCAAPTNTSDRLYKDAIEVVGKLTTSQLNILSLTTVLLHVSNDYLTSFAAYIEWLKKLTLPLLADMPKKEIEVSYLSHLGLCQYSVGQHEMLKPHKTSIAGLFTKGFTEQQLIEIAEDERPAVHHLAQCQHDSSKMQPAFLSEEVIRTNLCNNTDPKVIDKLCYLLNSNMMGDVEIKQAIANAYPEYNRILEIVDKFSLQHLQMNPVGQAIGLVNIEAKTGVVIGTDDW